MSSWFKRIVALCRNLWRRKHVVSSTVSAAGDRGQVREGEGGPSQAEGVREGRIKARPPQVSNAEVDQAAGLRWRVEGGLDAGELGDDGGGGLMVSQLVSPLNRSERRRRDALRRKYERERRKFDQWVEPQGERPLRKRAAKRVPKEVPQVLPPQGVEGQVKADPICVAEHHSDRQTKVLYEMREICGEFSFRDTILAQLDRYFVYLDRMQKRDPDAFGFYKEVGASLLPYVATPDLWACNSRNYSPDRDEYDDPRYRELSQWFLKTRPGFACIAYGTSPEAERIEREGDAAHRKEKVTLWIPRFLYFIKYERPPWTLEACSGGDVYKMTIWWDRPDQRATRKHGVPQDYGVFVGRNGELRALKRLDTRFRKVVSKRNGLDAFEIPQRAWSIPDDLEVWARYHGTTAQIMLTEMFCKLAHQIERTFAAKARVSIEKDGRHAMFAIDIGRMPYFFKDRDYDLSAQGHQRPIYHEFRKKDGSIGHRGLKDFTWAGYNVHITLPDVDRLEEYDVGAWDSAQLTSEEIRKTIPHGEAGRLLREHLDRA